MNWEAFSLNVLIPVLFAAVGALVTLSVAYLRLRVTAALLASFEGRVRQCEETLIAIKNSSVDMKYCEEKHESTWMRIQDKLDPIIDKLSSVANGALADLSDRISRIEGERISRIEAKIAVLEVKVGTSNDSSFQK